MRFGASLASGLLIGLERERNPAAKAGVRTFALVALLGTLAASAGDPTWTVPVGLAAVAAMLIVAYSREPAHEDPGTTTVVAALVCYLLGVLAGVGEPALAGALAIGVTALLYFKPEIEGVSTALKRHEQVSILQFLVVTFIVLPILPDRGYGPYAALNPRNIWLMVVLVSGIGLASYVALRAAGSRHGVLVTGILSGLLSSTAATVLYARRSRESAAMERLAFAVVPLANLVPLARIAVLAAVVAPALLADLAPLLGAALAAGLGAAVFFVRGVERGDAPVPESANPAEMGTALRFGALYAIVLLAAAWLADVAGHRGLYAAALAAGTVDIDPIVLSALKLFNAGDVPERAAVAMIALAYLANVAFKLGILVWFNRRLAWRALWPLAATVGAGGAAFALG
ncbi:MAG TPA: MgtC/SapB family protein [Burkholderiales bacterium]|nr:MgtC/SapB family protein [Burkholderiales bacterium]